MLNNWQTLCPDEMRKDTTELIQELGLRIKFVNPRKTKFGDFRVAHNKPLTITINNNLNVIHASLTFFHELAHAVCYQKFGSRVKPHGKEWKKTYAHFVLEMLDHGFFPKQLEHAITSHAINTKSSTCYDVALMSLLHEKPTTENTVHISELDLGDQFTFQNHTYELGPKRRTRFMCYRLPYKKPFTFSAAAMVELDK